MAFGLKKRKIGSLMGFKPTEGLPVELKTVFRKKTKSAQYFMSLNKREYDYRTRVLFLLRDHFSKTLDTHRTESYSIYLLYKLYEDNINLLPIWHLGYSMQETSSSG